MIIQRHKNRIDMILPRHINRIDMIIPRHKNKIYMILPKLRFRFLFFDILNLTIMTDFSTDEHRN